VLDNDTDDDGDTLTATLVDTPSDGTVSLSADGSFEYTPDAGFVGEDSFTYEASDGNGGTDQATVTVNVTETTTQNAYFRVDITDVNGSVVAGEDVVVEYTVENTGNTTGTQDVTFTVESTQEGVETGVTLGSAGLTNGTFTYTTSTDDTPAINIGISSENDTVTERVEVRDEGGGDDCVNRRNLGSW